MVLCNDRSLSVFSRPTSRNSYGVLVLKTNIPRAAKKSTVIVPEVADTLRQRQTGWRTLKVTLIT